VINYIIPFIFNGKQYFLDMTVLTFIIKTEIKDIIDAVYSVIK